MDAESLRNYCLSKKAVTEGFPFDESTLVFKVAGKMFALLSLDSIPLSISLKCKPEKAIELRETYATINAGYHLNKKHWNTVLLEGEISQALSHKMIDDSYELVIDKLTKKIKLEMGL